MQLKGLILTAFVVAAVSAQTIEKNACTECIAKTFEKSEVCGKLSAADKTTLTTAFGKPVDAAAVTALAANEAIKGCLCDFSAKGFVANGPATSCSAGTPAACDAAQFKSATDAFAALSTPLKCSAAGGSPSPSASASASGTTTGPTPTKTNGAVSMAPVSYMLSVAAVGAAAFIGL